MKKLCLALLSAGLMSLPGNASAQVYQQPPPPVLGHYYDFYFNQIADPGFEQTPYSHYWDDSQSYIDTSDGDQIHESFGELTSSSHTGSKAFDMEIYGGGYGHLLVNILHQDLAYPVKGDLITSASVYVQASAQYIDVTIYYTDGTASHATKNVLDYDAPHGSNGWQLWDFTSIVKKTKTISAIEFVADSGEGSGIRLDDVSLTAHYHIFIPD